MGAPAQVPSGFLIPDVDIIALFNLSATLQSE